MTQASSGNSSAYKAEHDLNKSIDAAGNAAHELKEAAKDIGRGTADAATRVADEKASDLGAALGMVAQKLSEARSEISEPLVAGLIGSAEGQIRKTASAAQHANSRELLAQAMTFARDNPAITIGAAVALGFGLARAGKVARRHMVETDGRDYARRQPAGQAAHLYPEA